MKRVTLTVVAVLLAVPALAHAKAGIEFDDDIAATKPGDQQSFTAFAHRSSGGPPTVSFRNTRTGQVIHVKTVPTNGMGTGRGTVRLPDDGPWTVTMTVNGRSVGDAIHGQAFELGPPKVRVMGTMEPPADPPAAPNGDTGFPFWLLMLPGAGVAALGFWFARRRHPGAQEAKQALVLALALCLLAPAAASGKGGVIFDRYPDVQAVGSQMHFTVMLFDRPDVRPLVTFRNSKTGEIVRIRASRSDLNGVAYGKVALPSTGPWATTISVNGRPSFEDDAEPFRVGVGLTQTIPSADAERAADASRADASGTSTPAPRASDRGGSVWPWIALAALASAAAAFAVHRRRRWGAA